MKVRKISNLDLNTLIQDKLCSFLGKADPELVKKLSETLNRQIQSIKDTEDYNMDLISELVDNHVASLMEAGLQDLKSGDVLRLDSEGEELDNLNDAVNKEDYESYPFNHALEKEMRSYFLLRTEKKDSFSNLIKEFYDLAPKFMTTAELNVLKKVIEKAKERIFKNKLMFLNPPKGQEQGRLRKMSSSEIKAYGLIEDKIEVDERKDNHDLLALKELVLLMKGSEVHPLSIGPGFFSKYMPELVESGFQGVICSVEDNLLKKIQLATLPHESEYKDFGYKDLVDAFRDYSPIMASGLVFYNLMSSRETTSSVFDGKKMERSFNKVDTSFFNKNLRLYVTVDGVISGPKDKSIGYKTAIKNDTRILAAETFLIEKVGDEIQNTRIYFSAYDSSLLNPLLQHGSVNYGVNDMSFHSCDRLSSAAGSSILIEEYKTYMKDRYNKGLPYEGADVAAQLHFFARGKDGEKSSPTDMFKKENGEVFNLVAEGILEHNGSFILSQFMKWTPMINLSYVDHNAVATIKKLMAHAHPLTHRWLVSKYMKDQSGITTDPQETFFRRIVKTVENDGLKELLNLNSKK